MAEGRQRTEAGPEQGRVLVALLSGEQVRRRGGRPSTSAVANTTSEERRSDVGHCCTWHLLSRLLHALLLFFQPRLTHLGRGPEQGVHWVLLHLAQKLGCHLRQFRQGTS